MTFVTFVEPTRSKYCRKREHFMSTQSFFSATQTPNPKPHLTCCEQYIWWLNCIHQSVWNPILSYSNLQYRWEWWFGHRIFSFLTKSVMHDDFATFMVMFSIQHHCLLIFPGYNSDIICLQEVDTKHFNKYFQPLLSSYGYQSSMYAKRHQKIPPDFFAGIHWLFATNHVCLLLG